LRLPCSLYFYIFIQNRKKTRRGRVSYFKLEVRRFLLLMGYFSVLGAAMRLVLAAAISASNAAAILFKILLII